MTLYRIISGGQTGADRAALDAALERGFPCGGWCPPGRQADDGPLPSVYPLQELSHGGYRQRTIKNIDDSDGTVIFYFKRPVGGTELTLFQCIKRHKPYQLIDANEIQPLRSGEIIRAFVQREGIGILNIAGPSEKRSPGIYAYALRAMQSLLTSAPH